MNKILKNLSFYLFWFFIALLIAVFTGYDLKKNVHVIIMGVIVSVMLSISNFFDEKWGRENVRTVETVIIVIALSFWVIIEIFFKYLSTLSRELVIFRTSKKMF